MTIERSLVQWFRGLGHVDPENIAAVTGTSIVPPTKRCPTCNYEFNSVPSNGVRLKGIAESLGIPPAPNSPPPKTRTSGPTSSRRFLEDITMTQPSKWNSDGSWLWLRKLHNGKGLSGRRQSGRKWLDWRRRQLGRRQRSRQRLGCWVLGQGKLRQRQTAQLKPTWRQRPLRSRKRQLICTQKHLRESSQLQISLRRCNLWLTHLNKQEHPRVLSLRIRSNELQANPCLLRFNTL
ncbi:hypothetical protein IAT38_005400 [Cryptococcus sp. DSM 104549]